MTSSTNAVRRVDITISTPKDSWLFIAKIDIRRKFESWCDSNTNQYVFQEEKTGEKNYHIQGHVRLIEKIRTRTLVQNLSEYLEVEPNFVSISPTSNACGDFSYVMKEETRINSKIYSDREYNLEQVRSGIEEISFFDWQKFIEYNWLDNSGQMMYNVSRRKILFVYDKKGGNGKSTYVKDLWLRRSKEVGCVTFDGTIAQCQNAILDCGARKYYVLDLPRSKPRNKKDLMAFEDNFVNLLEKLQNGFIIGTMYGKYKPLVMNNPQVVVFMNWKLTELMSRDRYLYIDLNEKEKLSEIQTRLRDKLSQSEAIVPFEPTSQITSIEVVRTSKMTRTNYRIGENNVYSDL